MDKKKLTTRTAHILRILVGGYLLYTAYTLIEPIKVSTGTEFFFFLIATIVFSIIGVVLIAVSTLALKNGNYIDGGKDN